MSVTHFTRQFRAEMGMSPHQYVVRRRIERAKYLLGYTQEPIAQIAHGCGFSHQEHLSGMFRRHVGETPARYRRRKRGERPRARATPNATGWTARAGARPRSLAEVEFRQRPGHDRKSTR